MPIASSALDTIYTANTASQLAGVTRAQVDEAVWLAVNGRPRRQQRVGLRRLQSYYPSLDARAVFLTSTVVAEVEGDDL